MAWPQKLEADTRCHAKSPTDQELQYSGCVQCGSTVRASTVALKGRGLALHGPGRTDDQRTISIGPIDGTM